MSYTPGPWMLGRSGNLTNQGQRPIVSADEDGLRIALVDLQSETVRKNAWQADDPEREANAALIAAAPELLEALEKIYDLADLEPDAPDDSKREALADISIEARAAIAKARNAEPR